MAHFEELSTDLQTALTGPVVGPISVEMIFDPDGLNIDLSAYIDYNSTITVQKKKNKQPGSYGKFTVGEVNVQLKNTNDYFNFNNIESPFYHKTTRLYATAGSSDTTIDVQKGGGDNFEAGLTLEIHNEDGYVSKTISSIDTDTYSNYDRITLSAAVGSDFDAGCLVETPYLAGRKVTLKNTIDGVTDKIEQFTGVLKSLPKTDGKIATITLYDNFIALLEVELKANDYRYLTNAFGKYESSLTYEHADGSTYFRNDGDEGFKFRVISISTVPQVGAIYRHNDSEYKVEEVEIADDNGFLRCIRNNGTDDPVSTGGTLSKVSGTGDSSVEFLYYKEEGYFDFDDVTINSARCLIGEWTIEITTLDGDFVLTDPNGNTYEGTVDDSDAFYVGSSSAYQMMWSGDSPFGDNPFYKDWEVGDVIRFTTVCALGSPVNSYNTISEMIYRLLIEDFGADLSTSDLQASSFTDLIDDFDEMIGSVYFSEPTTVLKAIELLQAHIMGTHFARSDGTFELHVLRPESAPSTIYSLSPYADIREVEQEDMGRIERIIANYNYDGSGYLSRIIIPEGSNNTGNAIELNFPAYKSAEYGQARAIAERNYLLWRRGVKQYEITEKWTYGLALEINDIVYISALYPAFDEKMVIIDEISKELIKGELKIIVHEPETLWKNYAFCGTDYLDRGKVLF